MNRRGFFGRLAAVGVAALPLGAKGLRAVPPRGKAPELLADGPRPIMRSSTSAMIFGRTDDLVLFQTRSLAHSTRAGL